MSSDSPKSGNEFVLNEDEIFKSLSHQLRRNILKVVGVQKSITFTEIKNKMLSIDSPTLAYHLKSLKYLLDQKENLYSLTDLGKTALTLINKIDHTQQLQKSRNSFLYANILTTVLWNILQIVVINMLWTKIELGLAITILVLFIIFNQINVQIVWRLYAIGYGLTRNNKKVNEKPSEKQSTKAILLQESKEK